MSREIKFRIWRAPDEYTKVSWMESLDSLLNYSMSDIFQLDNPDDVLEQFTGLKDRNGKDIYEGDIVKFSDDLAIVKFGEFGVPDARTEEYVDKALGFYFDPKVSLSDIEPFSMTIPVNELYACCTEVIGNIHTNPELLEESNE